MGKSLEGAQSSDGEAKKESDDEKLVKVDWGLGDKVKAVLRPKVVFHADSSKYVMWMLSGEKITVAAASKPAGPFEFVKQFYANKEPIADFTIFEDPEAKNHRLCYSRPRATGD